MCRKKRHNNGKEGSRAQYSSLAPPNRAETSVATFGIGRGTKHLYALNNRQEKNDLPNIVTSMIRIFDFIVSVLLDPEVSLSFETAYVSLTLTLFLINLMNHSMFLLLLVSPF